uniref:Uncharacterized protein n=1 Tax=Romanomermis culicivorax TaxID=13658 RepID=A0A915HZU8_ROMCU
MAGVGMTDVEMAGAKTAWTKMTGSEMTVPNCPKLARDVLGTTTERLNNVPTTHTIDQVVGMGTVFDFDKNSSDIEKQFLNLIYVIGMAVLNV